MSAESGVHDDAMESSPDTAEPLLLQKDGHDVEVSSETRAVLLALGVFAGALTLWIIFRALQLLAKAFAGTRVRKKKPAKSAAENLQHLQPRQAPGKCAAKAQQAQGRSVKSLLKQQHGRASAASHAADAGSHSSLYLNTLKGHSDVVNGIGWSPDALHLASACEDRTIRVFNLKGDIAGSNITFRRKNMTKGLSDVAFGKTSSNLVVLTKGTLDAAGLTMFSLDASGAFSIMWEVPSAHEGGAALTVDGCAAGAFATCGQKTDMRVFTSAGREAANLNTAGLTNHGVALSANGQFLAAATFTADVKVHQLLYEKDGEFRTTAKVMDLKGHTRQVAAVAFRPDGKRAVTVSNDHSLRIWNLAVRYHQREDAKLLVDVPLEHNDEVSGDSLMGAQLPDNQSYTHLAYGAHNVIAAGLDRTVHMIDGSSGSVLQVIEDAHIQLTYLQWSPVPRRIGSGEAYILASAGDRRLRLWRSA